MTNNLHASMGMRTRRNMNRCAWAVCFDAHGQSDHFLSASSSSFPVEALGSPLISRRPTTPPSPPTPLPHPCLGIDPFRAQRGSRFAGVYIAPPPTSCAADLVPYCVIIYSEYWWIVGIVFVKKKGEHGLYIQTILWVIIIREISR